MSFIEVEQVTYTYPVPDDYSEELANESKNGMRGKNEGQKAPSLVTESQPALKEVSLSIEEGQFVCILGRNGSGKSTLARQLNALLLPDEGKVRIDGMDTADVQHLWDIRSMVGMVFQNPDNQIIGSVVEEDVAFGLENLGIPSAEIQKRVAGVLEDVGMSAYAKRSPNNLSGGQKQRIAVAGILAMEPRCIVLDEATAMLDPQGRKAIMDLARRLNKEKGITIIAITHYMDEAVEADRVFVMDQGRIAMSGKPAQVFAREKEIEALGLKLPQASKLASMLRERGFALPECILTADELVQALRKPENKA